MKDGEIKWIDLPETVRNDIAENVYEDSEYLKGWNYWTWLNYLNGEDFTLTLKRLPVKLLMDNLKHYHSKKVLADYTRLVKSGVEMDPIIVNGGKFYDGGHRLKAYAAAGKETIPTIDISKLLSVNWEKFMDGQEDIP